MLQHRRQPAVNLPILRSGLGTSNIPKAPRTMVQKRYSTLGSLLEQIQDNEAKKLYPRLALFEALSGFKDKYKPRQQSEDPICEARRNFLDSFAYLCDVQKGGNTVTAVALQQRPHSDFLWMAANEGIRDDIRVYATDILANLRTATLENQRILQDTIFKLAVEKCKPRIQFYKENVQKYATNCRMSLRHREKDDTVKLIRAKLKKLSEPRSSWTVEAYVDLCHDMRNAEYHQIKRYSANAGDEFSRLAHYVWRLGATREAANTVVEAMVTVPSLKRVHEIRTVSAPATVEKTIHPSCVSPHEVLHGISADSASRNPMHYKHAFARLHELDSPFVRPIHSSMVSRQTIVTRVHAELQIADTFSRSRDIEFVDKDKYIGCSKSACYFCYNWLCNHKHYYVQPATHHKIIPGCRGPDDNLNETGRNVLVDMYSKIVRQIGQDILDFLQENLQPRLQYMSTEASSRATSRLSATRR
ncbi:uncharacterized protein CC84DRAFT_1087295 [Paraphaeosphaeria sporulosa]|uniref:Uncharacterized protein n=1 Tax=Paraphaeosphaeria sporulosa TaxID=1460663 RepID=A0A177CLK0_9PLEO|nr:uncharacterized protein CC84DRAFT_1087295 [Paraphaeosphaeria sporulosa]OAG08424.1 hypothetical protein CC84DRAFT_1087295 [Paraphaeosphaeria sporulosa]